MKLGRPSHTTVVAYLSLFLVISGGVAYAASHLGKNSVGSKQLKNNSVTTAKIKNQAITAAKVKNGALTGKQINASTLGVVPNASHATNSDQLGGSAASAFRDKCPSGTAQAAPDLCATTSDSQFAKAIFTQALEDCASIRMRLPSPTEALLLVSTTTDNEGYWTDDFWLGKEGGEALSFIHKEDFPQGGLFAIQTLPSTTFSVRCVTAPSTSGG